MVAARSEPRDTAEAVTRLLDRPGADGDVFSVGGTREISILDLEDVARDLPRSSASGGRASG